MSFPLSFLQINFFCCCWKNQKKNLQVNVKTFLRNWGSFYNFCHSCQPFLKRCFKMLIETWLETRQFYSTKGKLTRSDNILNNKHTYLRTPSNFSGIFPHFALVSQNDTDSEFFLLTEVELNLCFSSKYILKKNLKFSGKDWKQNWSFSLLNINNVGWLSAVLDGVYEFGVLKQL